MAADAVPFVEVIRGDRLESLHRGHAVIVDGSGHVTHAWGDPDRVIYPRSSAKMLQALPLAETFPDLPTERLALACASHSSAPMHVDRVRAWLGEIELSEDALVCGAHEPKATEDRDRLILAGETPGRAYNNCSGKHTGMLCQCRHHGWDLDYVDIGHPLQRAIRTAIEEEAGEDSPGHGIDGCSAPNYAMSLFGLARAMARFATAEERGDARSAATLRLRQAMAAHPLLVAGEGRSCSELMPACGGGVALKTGAEGVYVAMVPGQGLGIALKIEDGATRAAEAAIAALLVKVGALDAAHPAARRRLNPPIENYAGLVTGELRVTGTLM